MLAYPKMCQTNSESLWRVYGCMVFATVRHRSLPPRWITVCTPDDPKTQSATKSDTVVMHFFCSDKIQLRTSSRNAYKNGPYGNVPGKTRKGRAETP